MKSDIYGSHTKNLEHFTKTPMFDVMGGYNGITWETVPELHRQRVKQVTPAFSTNSIRAKEPTMHKYIDLFVQSIKEMRQLEHRKSSRFLNSIWGLNLFLTVTQVLKKFPAIAPFKILLLPPRGLLNMISAKKTNMQELERRIARRGTTKHLDHFDQLLPADADEPDAERKSQFATITAQILLAGWEPVGSQFQCCIMFSLQEPETYRLLVQEIRGAFKRYEDIVPEALADLKYLHAALMETLRVTVIGSHGMPRVSPGAMVDGRYIPKGVTVQYNHLRFTRSTRYFHEPRAYRPQRWLPRDHPCWDDAFKDDATEQFFPFSRGPRQCLGTQLAWRETRLFIAKVLWSFDVEMAASQKRIDFDRDFTRYAMWEKPQFRVRFHPVQRDE
ncbi:hypothetical protein SLS63_005803 [Diaporthe eres]|uniref:Cytochrome P450 n=1 Tax=Diaporthe eres TaxID=83184 RepID=A0ABR1PAA3_DIAER